MTESTTPLLEIDNLKTYFHTLDGTVRAVDGVSLTIMPGQTVGLVGESGCGKSVTASSVMLLLPKKTSEIAEGSIQFSLQDGRQVDIAQLNPDSRMIRSIRGNEISMIFQEPLTSLSPVHTVGAQSLRSSHCTKMLTSARRGHAQSICCSRWAYPTQINVMVSTPISSPAECASGR